MTANRRKAANLALTVLAAATVAGLSGCIHAYRINPAPNMRGLNMTHGQRDNSTAIVINETLRQLDNDLATVLLLDRPSLLTDMPIPR